MYFLVDRNYVVRQVYVLNCEQFFNQLCTQDKQLKIKHVFDGELVQDERNDGIQ